jgi:hypothetical protein
VRLIGFKNTFHAAPDIASTEFQQTVNGRVCLHRLQQTHADHGKADGGKQGNRGIDGYSEVPAVMRA